MAIPEVAWAHDIANWEDCHLCNDGPLEGGPVSIEERTMFQDITCNACGATWVDMYQAIKRRGVQRDE